MQPLSMENRNNAGFASTPRDGLLEARTRPADNAGRAWNADFQAAPAAFARLWAIAVFLTLASTPLVPAGDSTDGEALVAALLANRAHAVKAGDWAMYRYRGEKDEYGYFHIAVVKVEESENSLLATVRYQERDERGNVLSEKEESVPAADIIGIITGIDWSVPKDKPDEEKQPEIAQTSVTLFNGKMIDCLQVRGSIDFLVFDMNIAVSLSEEVPFGLVTMTWTAVDGDQVEEAASSVLVGFGRGGADDTQADANTPAEDR